jgi:branched-chain amino acid transport system ATP-binding protein
MDEIRVENLYASYRSKEVLRGVSLCAKGGEILTIIGPNGAGKSTLLKVLTGFLAPLRGEIFLGGRPVTSLAPHERARAGVAYCMQAGRVFPSLTVAENLELAQTIVPRDRRKEDRAAILEEFPGLGRLVGKRAGLLSGGERQALAVAAAFIRQPRFLLLDEPSAGLSPLLVGDILQKIRKLNERYLAAIIMVEQNVQAALRVGDRAMVLVNGRAEAETRRPLEWLSGGQLEQFFLGGR